MTNEYGNLLLHRVLLSALKDIDRLCRAHGLRCFLHAGTLLGAANHRGFIPWDDDADVSLFRADYLRLLPLLRREYGDKYVVETYETEEACFSCRAALRISGTRLTHHHPTPSGRDELYVDIVPLDSAPDSPVLRRLQQGVIWVLDAALQIKAGTIRPRHPVMKCIGLLSRADRVWLCRRMERAATRYNGKPTTHVGLLTYTGRNPYTGASGYENDLMERAWFDHPAELDFEDTRFFAPSHWEAELTRRYGPLWAEPFPEEKRVTKHDVQSYTVEPWVLERPEEDR